MSNNNQLSVKRHSFAHIMAAAVKQMFPETQFGVGPVVENGCYYDFVLPRTLIPEDLPLIEEKIRQLLKRNLVFKVQEASLEEAVQIFTQLNQPLKLELLNDLATKGTTKLNEEEADVFGLDPTNVKITIYRLEDEDTGEDLFVDLCRGPHIESIRELYPLTPLKGGTGDANPEALTQLGRFPFNNKLTDRAKEMLENPTDQENLVWDNILKSKLTGYKFSRQKIIDNYILDFYCSELLLAIEIDGSHHKENFQAGYDEARDSLLSSFGIKVIRVSNDEVKDLDKLREKIETELSERKSEISKPLSEGGTNLPLSRGPGGMSIGFSLDKFSGSYWRGDQERNLQMQRIYALVFETQGELEGFLHQREESQKRDHRKIGKELELFMTHEEIGAGLPIYLPKGAVLRQILEAYMNQKQKEQGYQYVYTPHIGKSDLFRRSGHLDHYQDGMYAPIQMVNLKGEGAVDGKVEEFYLKPMNCPFHHHIYLSKPRSYRDLPVKLSEYGTVYRYEESGVLSGLIRVRGFTQNDAHVYCTKEQMTDVFVESLLSYIEIYKDLGVTDYQFRFSLPDFENDQEKYGEHTPEWDEAIEAIQRALDQTGIDYYEAVGEAAFYGPKIDVQVKNVNGKEDTLSTIQVDMSIAPKFGITYTAADGSEQVPAIMHRALMGSIDRFMAFLIEMHGGRFPFWLAPTQVKILTINDQVLPYVHKIEEVLKDTVLMKPLKYNEIRYEIDDRSESLGKKIREAEMEKVPVMLIVGPKDEAAGQVSVRTHEGEEKVELAKLQKFLVTL